MHGKQHLVTSLAQAGAAEKGAQAVSGGVGVGGRGVKRVHEGGPEAAAKGAQAVSGV